MKILSGKYPECQDTKWVVWNSGPEINRVFLYRLCAYARDVIKKPITFVVGYRSTEKQAQLYALYVAGKGNPANKPGLSWHEFTCAADVGGGKDLNPIIYSDYVLAPGQQKMNAYGLYVPLWAGNSTGKEWWHIQPIEASASVPALDRCMFLDENDLCNTVSGHRVLKKTDPAMKGNDVKLLQRMIGTGSDGSFGGGTETVLKAWQPAHGLTPDGVCGEGTWKALLAPPTVVDWKVECQKRDSQIGVLENLLVTCQNNLNQTSIARDGAVGEAKRLQGLIDAYNKSLVELK